MQVQDWFAVDIQVFLYPLHCGFILTIYRLYLHPPCKTVFLGYQRHCCRMSCHVSSSINVIPCDTSTHIYIILCHIPQNGHLNGKNDALPGHLLNRSAEGSGCSLRLHHLQCCGQCLSQRWAERCGAGDLLGNGGREGGGRVFWCWKVYQVDLRFTKWY